MKINEILIEAAADEKAKVNKIRGHAQAGTIDQRMAFSLKKRLVAVIKKYTNEDWEIKQNFLDAGVYYVGDDLNEANRVGKEMVGALYGFFQDGSKKTITKLKREEDSHSMTFTAIPTPDSKWNRNAPQLSFTWHKNAVKGGPVIAININAQR